MKRLLPLFGIVALLLLACTAQAVPPDTPTPHRNRPLQYYSDALEVYVDTVRGVACYSMPEMNYTYRGATTFSCVVLPAGRY